MKKQNFLLVCILGIFFLWGCSEKEDPAQIVVGESSIEFFQKSMDFPSEGGSNTITFNANRDWTISLSDAGGNIDWCTVSPQSGSKGDATIIITTKANDTYSDRNVVATLTAGDAVEKIRINQKQNDAILLTSDIYEVPMEGGEIEVQVKSNVTYKTEIPEKYQSWIHSSSTSRALATTDLKFSIDRNEDYDKREGEILISNGNITEVVKIYQAGGAILVLSQNDLNIPTEGGFITIDLKSNFEYEMELPNVDWIRLQNGTRGMSSHTVHLEVLTNETFDNREASVLFSDPQSNLNESVTIHQAQKDAIIISNKDYTVDSGESFITVDINTNVEFEVEIPNGTDTWISQTNDQLTRALIPYKLDFKIAANSTYDAREGKIIIKNKSTELADTVYVHQAQKDGVFIVSNKDVSISYEGGEVSVEADANVELEYEYLQDWTHTINATRGLVRSSHSFMVDENDTPYDRVGKVVVRKANSDYPADTMYIHQDKGFLTLNVTPGNLAKLLEPYNELKIEMLKLSGSMNVQDYFTIRKLSSIWNLNLSEITDKTMPQQAFVSDKNIKKIKLPSKLEEIPKGLFDQGSEMGGINCKLEIPKTVKKIREKSFRYTSIVGDLIIPEKIDSIEQEAFNTTGNIQRLYVGDNVTYIGPFAFAAIGDCVGISEIHLGENIKKIDDGAFHYIKFPGTFVIPDKVEHIGYGCFSLSEFTSIVLGKSLKTIGEGSFNDMQHLESIYCKSITPPLIQPKGVIENTPMLYLGVPKGCKEAYEHAEPWKNFMVIEEIDYDNFVIPSTE